MKHRAWLLPSFVVLLVAVLIILIAGSTSAAPPIAQADRPKLDVPFVPTPRPVVDKMLELATPTADDYLIDLGSGDGRIPITAAQRFGTRGLGIDIDPRRIAEARKSAEEAGVSDKVEFRQEDLFETDISQATILTLYLLPSVNIKLRPRILKELRPGTRVVSHDWDMGDWRPDQTVELGNKTVFMWVVPASAEGRWQVSDSETGRSFALRLKQRYQDVEGEADIDGQQVPLRNPRIEGDRIFFELPSENGDIKHYEGRIAEQVIEGEGWQAKPLTCRYLRPIRHPFRSPVRNAPCTGQAGLALVRLQHRLCRHCPSCRPAPCWSGLSSASASSRRRRSQRPTFRTNFHFLRSGRLADCSRSSVPFVMRSLGRPIRMQAGNITISPALTAEDLVFCSAGAV